LIGPEGEQLGVFPRDVALKKARDQALDLVEVAPQASPPVCRIMDFAKYRYDQEKKERESKKHQRQVQLKEIRLRPRIDMHDYEIKIKRVREFLSKGHKVKVRLMFRGREMSHQEIGRKLVTKLITDIDKVGKVDREPQMFGRSIITVLCPK